MIINGFNKRIFDLNKKLEVLLSYKNAPHDLIVMASNSLIFARLELGIDEELTKNYIKQAENYIDKFLKQTKENAL